MSDRTTGRTSIRSRLGALLGVTLLVSSVAGSFAPSVLGAGVMSITNVDSPDPVVSGQQLTYTITMGNTGGAKVSGVTFNDTFNGLVGIGNPPLLDVVSSVGTCTQNNLQVTCVAGDIAGGGAWTVTVRGVVTSPSGTTINNTATVSGGHGAQSFSNTATASTLVQGGAPGGNSPDLTLAKNGPLSAAAGGPMTYTLTVNNIGNAAATGIKVTDTTPLDTSQPITATGTSLFTCGVVGAKVTCTGGQVNAGSNATITITGKAPASGPMVNTSVVDPENTIDEGVLGSATDAAELNNTSNTVTTDVSPIPPPPVGAIKLDKVGPAQATPGEVIHYTDHGHQRQRQPRGLPDDDRRDAGPPGRQPRRRVRDRVQWHRAVLFDQCGDGDVLDDAPATGGTMVIKFKGMVIAAAGSTILNNASVSANIKNKDYAANDTVQTVIKPGVDLTITKSDSPDPVCASSWPGGPQPCGGGLTYSFTVGNSGINTASNVIVRDPIPAGTVYDDAASSGLCDPDVDPSVVLCTLPSVGPGATVTFSIKLLAPDTTGSISNTVAVDRTTRSSSPTRPTTWPRRPRRSRPAST